jgi:hypothetical protein
MPNGPARRQFLTGTRWPQRARRLLAAGAIGGGVLDLAFWLLYAAGIVTLGEGIAQAYERAFPVADALLGIVLIAAGAALSASRASGPFLVVVAGSMALYLGVLDLTFYLSHHLYRLDEPATLWALPLNLVCIAGGALALYWGWRLWRVS